MQGDRMAVAQVDEPLLLFWRRRFNGNECSMKSEMEIFREFIRRRNLRNTPEREQVIRVVFSTHDHFDVDELYLRLRRQKGKISKATVYRTIPLLLECGLIQEAYYEDGRMHYEHIYGHEHHCHLRCLDCGKIVEFIDKTISGLEEKLEDRHGFVVTGRKLEVYGYCPKCRAHRSAQGLYPRQAVTDS